jgi:hypothetical protein
MSGPAQAPLTPDEAVKLGGMLDMLVDFCDHSPGVMDLALFRHGVEHVHAVEELRADLATYAWILGAGR